MPQQELLKLVIARLDEVGIEYMLTGSLVSSLQGEPRATHDIDLVIAIRTAPGDAARALRAAFPEPLFYLDEEAIRGAIATTGMFDALRVYGVQHGLLDQSYLDEWAAMLGVAALLARLRSKAEPIE